MRVIWVRGGQHRSGRLGKACRASEMLSKLDISRVAYRGPETLQGVQGCIYRGQSWTGIGDCSGESGLPLDMTRVCLGPLGCHGYDSMQ